MGTFKRSELSSFRHLGAEDEHDLEIFEADRAFTNPDTAI